jgi:hypothetical protein
MVTAQQSPVLTVCEALHELPKYNGKMVIIVGRSAFIAVVLQLNSDLLGRSGLWEPVLRYDSIFSDYSAV